MILDYWWQLLTAFLAVYLFSNINFAIILANRVKHQDIRKLGSGNPGTTNMLRSFGIKMGALTFLLDCLKGVIAGLVGLFVFRAISNNNESVVLCACYILGLAAVLGHVFPVFIGFKGGKGFATGVGFFAVVNPVFTVIAIAAVIVIVMIFDYMSLGAILFFASQLTYSLITIFNNAALAAAPELWWIVSTLIIIWAVVMWAHRGNIVRLIRLKENKSNFKKLLSKKKRAALNASESSNDAASGSDETGQKQQNG